jgi:hypothetical protein
MTLVYRSLDIQSSHVQGVTVTSQTSLLQDRPDSSVIEFDGGLDVGSTHSA